MVHRHIALAREHVARQRALVTRLRERGLAADAADALLATFETTLGDHLDHLRIIRADQKAGRRDAAGRLVFPRVEAPPL